MAKRLQGIYLITINGKPYIGKDSDIANNYRRNYHLRLLRSNSHYNTEMQNDFNLYGEQRFVYKVLKTFEEGISEEEHNVAEKEYIKAYDSYNNGYNKTLGGYGSKGYKYTEELRKIRSEQFSGEKHPQAKITNEQFFEMVELFKQGLDNEAIADKFGLHPRYVSLIRHKKRFKNLWGQVEDYTPTTSGKGKAKRKLDYETYCSIRKDLESGLGNVKTEKKYNLSSGTASRIKNGKMYRDFYEKYTQ